MTQVTADFEMGVNGSAVLAADAGDADAWNSVADIGANITYSNTRAASGALSAQVATGGGGGNHVMIWGAAFGTPTDHYGRLYLYLTANPSSGTPIIIIENTGSRCARIDINSNGTIRAFDNASAALFTTTTNAIALNQWVRIEWHIVHSATVGQGEIKLFNTAASSTPTETSTGTANKNTLASANTISFGNGNGAASYTFWMDAIVAGATSYPGPVYVPSPVNTVAPVVSGTAAVGSTLTSTTGTWTGDPTITYGYQWQRAGVDISSATSSTYALVDADDALAVRCVVTGTNGSGSSSANSNATAAVVEPAPTNSVAPAVTGTAELGQTLSSSTGTWAHMGGTVATFSYQWQRDGVNVAPNTFNKVVTTDDQGHDLRCVVTATNTGGATSANSNVKSVPAEVFGDEEAGLTPVVTLLLLLAPVGGSGSGAIVAGSFLYPGETTYPAETTYPGVYTRSGPGSGGDALTELDLTPATVASLG